MPSGVVSIDSNDHALVTALRDGDERVFRDVVERWAGVMLRLALAHVDSRAVGEEVVQEAWLTVLRSLHRFEARSSVRTWVLGIVVNLARSRSRAERRAKMAAEPVDDRTRFLTSDHPRWPHRRAIEPVPRRTPEDDLLAGETHQLILKAVAALPGRQREVLVLRDLEGLTGAEVCHILSLTDTHQRVLLHRARSRVRSALERDLAAPGHPSLPRIGLRC